MNSRKSESNMKEFFLSKLVLFVVLSCFTFLSIQGVAAEESDNPPLVGMVTKLLLDQGIMVVKNGEGKRHSVVFTEQTIFKGVFLPEEIKVKQKVKVWYELDNDRFIAVKIEVMPELGC